MSFEHPRLAPAPVLGALGSGLTGAEALIRRHGPLRRAPIRLAWCGLVLPAWRSTTWARALLMRDPSRHRQPSTASSPRLVLPAILLATAAIIASQAVISGAYSMTKRAIQLGFLAASAHPQHLGAEAGQIYIGAVNWALLAGVVGAVLLFRSSSSLAGAYGIAVTLTMAITTVLTYFVVRHRWGLPAWVAWGATAFFLLLDLLLVAGCAVKFFDGGWFPRWCWA